MSDQPPRSHWEPRDRPNPIKGVCGNLQTPSKCHQHLCFALPQGNHPHGGAKTSNTCQDGSKCPINHRNLNGCPKVVRIQSGVCGNLCDDPDMHVFTRHPPDTKEIMPTLAVCPPTRQTALAVVRKPPTHVMMVRNVRSTTEISVRAPRSSESNQRCVEILRGEPFHPPPTRIQAHVTNTCFLSSPQGNHPRNGAKTFNTCHDGSKWPINHQDLTGSPEIVRIQSVVWGNLRDDPDMRVDTHHPPKTSKWHQHWWSLPPARQLPSRR